MKAKMLILLSLCLGFVGCVENTPITPEPAEDGVIIILELEPQLQNGIIVSPVVHSFEYDSVYRVPTLQYGDSLSLCNTCSYDNTFLQDVIQLSQHAPFIHLKDNFVLVHWRWNDFIPLSIGFSRICDESSADFLDGFSQMDCIMFGNEENNQYYYIDMDYHDLTDIEQQWALTEGQKIQKPNVYDISWRDLDKYRGDQIKLTDVLPYYGGVYSAGHWFTTMPAFVWFSSDDAQENAYVSTYIEKNDSLEQIYIKTLIEMITNKDFEKCATRY